MRPKGSDHRSGTENRPGTDPGFLERGTSGLAEEAFPVQ